MIPPKIPGVPGSEPAWKRFRELVTRHETLQNLTEGEVKDVVRYSQLFNVLTNNDLQAIINAYPLIDQNLRNYW